ncbi:GNAT family N-acetyltransferase [Candidatus Saccharibacteria bacterium]|nr:GNAT family N-acetyltransferase [Candidatus Saccharibacteria bacterium]
MGINYKQKHLFQTEAWGQVQRALGKKIVSKEGLGWSYQAVIGPSPGKIGRYVKTVYLPYGPTFDSLEALKIALSDAYDLSRQQNADQIIIEPYNIGPDIQIQSVMAYYKRVKDRQPTLTLITDLSKPWEEVLLGMSKTNRYQWRYIERDQLDFSITTDPSELGDFFKMMTETSKRTGAVFYGSNYYKTIIEVLGPLGLAGVAYGYHGKNKLVGSLFVDDIQAKRRYYLYAGSYDSMRSIKYPLNAALVTYLQKDAQDKGLLSLDYFGVAPPEAPADHKWYGLSKFKRSLGGSDFATLGTWARDLNKPKMVLVKFSQKLVHLV